MTTSKTIKVDGSCRNDTFIYNMSGNAGRSYEYDGDGGTDTLQLEFTRAQWMSAGVQDDIARLRDYFARGNVSRDFVFNSFGLKIEDIEKAKIFVDGVELSLVDNAVCARDDAFGVKQDGRISGSVLGNDSVLDLVRGVSLVSGPSAGTLELKADGTFTYATGDAFDWLGAGQTTTVCFTYRVTDADGDTGTATVVLTVTGTNDAAVIGLPTVTQVTEDRDVASGKLTARGSIAISDVDRGEASFRTTVTAASGTLGTLTLAANGTYAYSVDNAATQYLAAGQTKIESFTITALDGTQKTIAFTITGTNDAVTITSGAQVGGVTEDVTATTGGTIAFTDVDLSDGHAATFTGPSAALGAFSLAAVSEAANAASGTVGWSYALDNAKAQFLAAGETRVENYIVTVADGQGGTVQQTVTVTITGTNDAPTITSAAQAGTVIEDVTANAAGTIAFTDVDLSDGHTATFTAPSGALGSFTLAPVSEAANAASGTVGWSYTLDNAKAQFLGAGETRIESYVVTVADGKGGTVQQSVAVTITGTNDAPTITSAAQAGSVTEDASATPTAAGTIAFTDVDLSDGHTATFTAPSGALGTFALAAVSEAANAASGTVGWSYTLDNAKAQFLAAGETRVESYVVTVADGKGGTVQQSVAVTITGTNDAPTITGGTFAGGVTDSRTATSLDAAGTIAFADVDLMDSHSVAAAPVGSTLGTLTASIATDTTGSGTGGSVAWAYHVDPAAVAYLGVGETRVETFAVTVADGKGGTVQQAVAVTITGTNDAAIIGTPSPSVVVEDQAVSPAGKLVAAGTLSISDLDQGQAHFAGFDAATGNLGTLTLGADGAYAYGVDNATVQYLGEGKTKVDTFTVRSVDGTTKDIAFTIQGANDAPVARDDHFTVADTGTVSLAVLANDTDVDGDDLTLSIVSQPLEGQIILDTSGQFVFDPGTTFASLSAGQSAEVGFDYRISDGHGGTSVAHATILVEGVGQFVSPLQTDKTTATVNHQPVSVSLTAPQQTGTLNNRVEVAIDLGAGNANKKNVFFVVDISGSTSLKFAGTPVGDLNGRDGANTILDAEIAGLIKLNAKIAALGYSPDDVTITVVPFNSKANPADWVSSKATPNIETKTFELGSASIDTFLKTLDAGGGTNYEEALQGVIEKLRVLDPTGAEGNIVYFLSDGEPNPVNTFGDEIATLNTQYKALMSAIGVGASVPLQYLDMIDNTGGAERVTSTDQLSAALLGAPFPTNHVVDFDLFVNGNQLTDIDIDDLVALGTGYRLNLDIDNLNALFGQNNSVVAAIELQDGTHLSVDLDISGVLPQTTVDFII